MNNPINEQIDSIQTEGFNVIKRCEDLMNIIVICDKTYLIWL